MPGRTHLAEPGQPACGVEGCARPAGFATDTPGTGPCRRHLRPVANRPRPARGTVLSPVRSLGGPNLAERTDPRLAVVEGRLRGPGRAAPNPLALIGVIVAAGRTAGFSFEQSWEVAAVTALAYMTDQRARDWWDVLDATRFAWADAYHHRRSPLQALPREVPAAIGYAEPQRGGRRLRLAQ